MSKIIREAITTLKIHQKRLKKDTGKKIYRRKRRR